MMHQAIYMRAAYTVCALLVVGPAAMADIGLELRPVSQNVVSGEEFEVELYAVASPDQPMGRIDAVLNWNAARVVLVQVNTAGGAAWSVSQLPSSHALNTDLTDGDGFYQARVNINCGDPGRIPLATSAGTLVTKLVFRAISPSTGASMSIAATGGGAVTQVWDDDTLVCNGTAYATAPLGPPVFAIVSACTGAGDCDDGDACTQNNCVGDTCEHPPIPSFDNSVDCCDPATGNLTTIDDGNECTRNVCNSSTGAVTHPGVTPGTACGDQSTNACTDPDFCDGVDTCLPNNRDDGGVCNHPDSCVLAATCLSGLCEGSSFEVDGTICDDGIACTGKPGLPDNCQAGVCEGGPTPCDAPNLPLCFEDGQGGHFCGNCTDDSLCPDIGCLHRGCSGVSFSCVTVLVDDASCSNGLFCDGEETCNQTFGSCEDDADPCTDPANPFCNETLGCFECTNEADCPDADLCNLSICNVVTGRCEFDAPVDCSFLNDPCNIGVCSILDGQCEPFAAESVDCPCPVGYTCSQATNKCLPQACNDQIPCTLFDRCEAGVCIGDDPIQPGGTLNVGFEPQTPPAIAVGQAVDLALVVSSTVSSTDFTILEALVNWNPANLIVTGRADPCVVCAACDPILDCPPGEYGWILFSGLPTGPLVDPDGINSIPALPALDGDLYYQAQVDAGDPAAPVTSVQSLTATVFTFTAVGATDAFGTEVLFSECDGANPTFTRIIRGAGNNKTASLFSATIRVNCTDSGQCDNGDPCTVGTCNLGTSFCEFASVSTGTACGNPNSSDCDQPDTCDGAGVCDPRALPLGTSCASDGNDCTTDTCDGAGTCDHTNVPANTACTDDGSECTSDFCDAIGTCTHPSLIAGLPCADDGSVCTIDACDGLGVCAHTPLNVGTVCDDQTECTDNDACDQAGNCVGVTIPNFCECIVDADCPPDGAFCTDDLCIDTGCVYLDTCADNGVFCDGVEACSLQSGICESSGDPCPDFCSNKDGCPQSPPLPAPAPHNIPKNRFLSIDPNNSAPVSLRVELLDLECAVTGKKCNGVADCQACVGGTNNGTACSINSDCPGGACEPSGETCEPQSPPVLLGWMSDPVEAGGDALPGTFTSEVVTTRPAARIWTEPVVHIGDCEIAPVHTYAICASSNGTTFSDPFVIGTIERPQGKFWGDIVGNFNGIEWSAPNGLVGVDDVNAMIKFLTLKPAPHITVVDLVGSSPTYVNTDVTATDLLIILKAFEADLFPPFVLLNDGYPDLNAGGSLSDCPEN